MHFYGKRLCFSGTVNFLTALGEMVNPGADGKFYTSLSDPRIDGMADGLRKMIRWREEAKELSFATNEIFLASQTIDALQTAVTGIQAYSLWKTNCHQ